MTTCAYHQAPGLGIIIANPGSHLRLGRSGDTDSFNTWKDRFSKAVRETSELKETTDSAELFQVMTLLRQLTNYKPKQRLANKPTTQGKTGTRTVCITYFVHSLYLTTELTAGRRKMRSEQQASYFC